MASESAMGTPIPLPTVESMRARAEAAAAAAAPIAGRKRKLNNLQSTVPTAAVARAVSSQRRTTVVPSGMAAPAGAAAPFGRVLPVAEPQEISNRIAPNPAGEPKGIPLDIKRDIQHLLVKFAKTDAWHDFKPAYFSSSISNALSNGLPLSHTIIPHEASEWSIFNKITGDLQWPSPEGEPAEHPITTTKRPSTPYNYTIQVVKIRDRSGSSKGPTSKKEKISKLFRTGHELAKFAGLVGANIIVDSDGISLIEALNAPSVSDPGFPFVNLLIVPENINDPAPKPFNFSPRNVAQLIQESNTAIIYEPYSVENPSYLNNFFSRYSFELSPIKEKMGTLQTNMKITLNDGDKTFTDTLHNPKTDNAIAVVKSAIKTVLTRTQDKDRRRHIIKQKGKVILDETPQSAPEATLNQDTLENWKLNSRIQGKRSGDWLQVLSCLDAPYRKFINRYDRARRPVPIGGPVYLLTHDILALSYALLVGVNVIFTSHDEHSRYIYIFRTGSAAGLGQPGAPMRMIPMPAAIQGVLPNDIKNYNKKRQEHLRSYYINLDSQLNAAPLNIKNILKSLLFIAAYNTEFKQLDPNTVISELPVLQKRNFEKKLKGKQNYNNIENDGETIERTINFIYKNNDESIIAQVLNILNTFPYSARVGLIGLVHRIFSNIADTSRPISSLLRTAHALSGGGAVGGGAGSSASAADAEGADRGPHFEDVFLKKAEDRPDEEGPSTKRARLRGGTRIPGDVVQIDTTFYYADDEDELRNYINIVEEYIIKRQINEVGKYIIEHQIRAGGGNDNYKGLILPTYLLIHLVRGMNEVIDFNHKGAPIDFDLYVYLARFYALMIKELHNVHDPDIVAELHKAIVHLGSIEVFQDIGFISNMIVSNNIDSTRIPEPSPENAEVAAILDRVADKVFVGVEYSKKYYTKLIAKLHKLIRDTIRGIEKAEGQGSAATPANVAVTPPIGSLYATPSPKRKASPRHKISPQTQKKKPTPSARKTVRRERAPRRPTMTGLQNSRTITGRKRQILPRLPLAHRSESNLQRILGGKARKYCRRFTRRR